MTTADTNTPPGTDAVDSIDVIIRICGAAGDGSLATGAFLNQAAARMGYHIMNIDLYPAEIRGFGKSVAHLRISDRPVHTPGVRADCLVALNDPHAITELDTLAEGAVVLYDSNPPVYWEEDKAIAGFIEPGMIGYGVPLGELSTRATRSARSRNIVALGSLSGIFRIDPGALTEGIGTRFGRKSAELAESNLQAFNLGREYALEHLEKADPIDFRDRVPGEREGVVVASGNQGAARACLDAGLRLYAGYPITPATRIMEILARELPGRGGVVIQTEDEISAIGHAIGAGFTGRRAATATSGPGLALMTEFLGLAVMAEVPVVVINGQRGGPSTGLPTKTEQSDLFLAVFGGSGDSPRPVLAPADVSEVYSLTATAFEIAEAFQTPVIVLLDLFICNRTEDVNWSEVDRDTWGQYEDLQAAPDGEDSGYRRFTLTDSGVSPRTIPGVPGGYHAVTGLEHNEQGLPDYTPENHLRMTQKRYRKMASLLERWPDPEPEGDEGAVEVGIVSWGTGIGSAREAMLALQEQGVSCAGFFPRLIWPLNADRLKEFATRCERVIVAESNFSGQFAGMVEQALGAPVVRVTGVPAEPLDPATIIAAAGGRS